MSDGSEMSDREIIAKAGLKRVRGEKHAETLERAKEVLTLLDEFRERMGSLTEDLALFSEAGGDVADYAASSAETEQSAEANRINQKRILELQKSIERLRKGIREIVTCEGCGGPIPPARIAVLPLTKQCVSCQTIDEGVARRMSAPASPYNPPKNNTRGLEAVKPAIRRKKRKPKKA
jgi:RNA polymerase-binding transcription factor DksA